MSMSVTIRRNVLVGATTYGENRIVTIDAPTIISETINAGVTDKSVLMAVDFSQLQLVCLYSTQDITIETVNATTPTDTVTLKAGVGKVWSVGETGCPFTADCSVAYFTNATGSNADVKVVIAHDVTP